MRPVRRVRVVVVDYGGGEMTRACLDALVAAECPPGMAVEVVLVDNASPEPVDHPGVTMVRSPVNLGFAAGCNLGIGALDGVDFVALINNDAVVAPDWLAPLVAAFDDGDPNLGAVGPKLVLADDYVGVRVTTTTTPEGARWVGARVHGVEVDGQGAGERVRFDEGAWPAPGGGAAPSADAPRALRAEGDVRVIAAEPVAEIAVALSAPSPRSATLDSGAERIAVALTPTSQWFRLAASKPFAVVNNAGSELYVGGFGGDRGFLERDDGRYDAPAEVFAWTGGAVLLKAAYLADAGRFDPRFFAYYEDTDLAWRGRRLGWTYRYVPASVVRHRHAATSRLGDVFVFHETRNRLLVLVKHAPVRWLARALAVATRDSIVAAARRDRSRGRPSVRVRALASFARLAPGAWRERRQLARRQRVATDEVLAWAGRKDDRRWPVSP